MELTRRLIGQALEKGASDIHLEEGSPVAMRLNGSISILDEQLSSEQMATLLAELLDPEKLEHFHKHGDLDTSKGIEGLSRIRINAYVSNLKKCLTLRILPDSLPKWEQLGLPQSFINLAHRHKGLILCTGPTGSGKSTSLASFINYIAATQQRHILTIEDPIEFQFNHTSTTIIHQREVKRDTASFATALRAALREDPDVIYIGEMRDLETIQLAITVGLIKAGEIGGILDMVIERISLFIERQENIKGQLVSALIYPCIMLVFALSVALGLLIGIVPKFANVFAQLNSELPTITKVMLALSGAVTNPVIMGASGALLVGGVLAAKAYYATSNGRLVLDRLVFSVPLFGSLLLKYEVASFCETLATLTNAGIPAVEGMEVTAGASNNQVIKNTIRFTAQRAEQGEVISEVLASTKIFPPLVAAMIRIGEESGQLSTMLENLGRFYTQEIEITVKKITKAMEPAITGVVSVIVGSIVLSLYLPMFKLMEVMGK